MSENNADSEVTAAPAIELRIADNLHQLRHAVDAGKERR
jgi:hypothetical protein